MAQMFEDLTLLLAPTSLTAAKEGLCHGKPFIVMKNDLRTRLVSDSSVSGQSDARGMHVWHDQVEAHLFGGTCKLSRDFEVWKTQDGVNFLKSGDVTHVIDLAAHDMLRKGKHRDRFCDDEVKKSGLASRSQKLEVAAEDSVVNTLLHGMAKCNTTVAFIESFL